MGVIKKYLNRIFIDGLSGMALGLFSTLIIGTILVQIGNFVGDSISAEAGYCITVIGKVASALMGAGIGAGLAYKFNESVGVMLSAMVAGMIGAYAKAILAGTVFLPGASNVIFAAPGEPLGAFLAAFAGIEVGRLVTGKTKVDILVTPIVTIGVGTLVGFLISPPISGLMNELGALINWGTQQQPFIMGIVVSVIMGILLTLPISSAAIGLILGLNGIAAGAATVGCCANMIGFAAASYRENKLGGAFAQGLGTSMLQMPNIVRKPIVWLPAIISSAILGPISTCVFEMENNAVGSGMGTCGLVGQINTFETMTAAGVDGFVVLIEILIMHIVLPAVLAYFISEVMRKMNWLKSGDLRLSL